MEIFNKYYKVDPHKLVDDLGKSFKFRLLDDRHVQGMYFLACPFHSNGQERTASANFSLINKGRTREGDFYCFGCKVSGHISSILTRLFGEKRLAEIWVEKHYGNLKGLVEEKREARRIEVKTPEQVKEEKQVFQLPEEAYYEETSYYEKRGIPDELVQRFKLGYLDSSDDAKKKVYIPVFDSEGDVVFYMTRNLHNKQFYLPKGAKKVLWGANEIKGGELCVCESVFNSLTLYKFGRQAVACFGTGDDLVYEQLLALPVRSFVLCLDNDEAGQNGTKKMKEVLLRAGRLVSTVFIDEPKKDLNDYAFLSQEEFDSKWNSWLTRGIHG